MSLSEFADWLAFFNIRYKEEMRRANRPVSSHKRGRR